jgi:hypothetical protein
MITVKDIALLSVFEVVVPSLDQGTDYYTAATLIHYGSDHWCKTSTSDYCVSPAGVARVAEEDLRVRRYGYAMLAPILLMTIFSLRQWLRLEQEPTMDSSYSSSPVFSSIPGTANSVLGTP